MCQRSQWAIRFFLFVACGLPTVNAAAQNRVVPRYTPRTPTVSPYVGLLNNGGDLLNYYSLVRPLQRQAEFNRQNAEELSRQSQHLSEVQRALETPATRPTGHGSWFATHRDAGLYFNRSHFYERWDARDQAAGR